MGRARGHYILSGAVSLQHVDGEQARLSEEPGACPQEPVPPGGGVCEAAPPKRISPTCAGQRRLHQGAQSPSLSSDDFGRRSLQKAACCRHYSAFGRQSAHHALGGAGLVVWLRQQLTPVAGVMEIDAATVQQPPVGFEPTTSRLLRGVLCQLS